MPKNRGLIAIGNLSDSFDVKIYVVAKFLHP